MKEAKNNEIDLMLRNLARREQSASGGLSPEAGTPAAKQGQLHLDADELNSYAENALPAAARARYTEHLADCSMCRKVAVQLSLTSGATLRPISAETRKPWSLKDFLSGIFTARSMTLVSTGAPFLPARSRQSIMPAAAPSLLPETLMALSSIATPAAMSCRAI